MEQVNPVACELLREAPEYLIGRRFLSSRWNMIDSCGNPFVTDQMLFSSLSVSRKTIKDLEVGIAFEEGVRWLSIHVAPLFSETEEYQGALASIFDITDKKTIEKKLRQREQRLLSITDSQTHYTIRTDLEGRFIYVNNAVLNHFGYEEDEMLYHSLDLITDRVYAIQCIKAAAYCMEYPGRHKYLEIRCYNSQREYFWTSWELVGIMDEEGRVTEIQAVGQDISKKKRVADLLVETSQMARIGGWEISGLTRKLSWTPETYRIHDVPENAPVTLKRALSFYHPDHQPIVRKAIRTLIQQGTPFDLKLKLISEQKREVWVRIIGQREIVHGNYVRAYGIIQDITTSQRSEEHLKQREWLLESIFNSTADALFILDRNNLIVDCNQNALRIFEIDRKEDVLGKGSDPFLKEPIADDEAVIRKKITETGFWTTEIEFISARNKPFWGNLALTTLNEVDYRVVRVTDITDQKDAEALLIESNQHLVKTNQELDRFVYSASHDLRAPLTSIIGLIQLSEMEEMEQTLKEYLQHMKKSANRLDSFIKDLTHFSRNARLEVRADPIRFEEIIQMLFEQYQFMDHATPVVTLLEVDQPGSFYSDKSRLQIALGNIISNALKYTHEQQEASYVKVIVSVKPDEAIIKVVDNGMGIASSHIEKVFDMFYRANDQKPGSGLGLYIVKETAEKLNGTAEITSTLGKGTECTLILPNLKTKS